METNLQQEVERLQQELAQRDVLIEQLSEELFRLLKGNVAFVPQTSREKQELDLAQDQIQTLEAELADAQRLIEAKDQEIAQLKVQIQEMSERIRRLEKIVQEMPAIYKQKFTERMLPIKAKVEMLQRENRELHMELQTLNYHLTKNIRPKRLELPLVDLPSF
ncbi:MAG: Npun_F5560 family protein [Pseudanabaenaceae cyanobacterium]